MKSYTSDDIEPLIILPLSEDVILKFFFKQGGEVNMNHACYLVRTYSQKDLFSEVRKLQAKGFIKQKRGYIYKLTCKAYINRVYEFRGLNFWVGVIALLTLILSAYLIWLSVHKG